MNPENTALTRIVPAVERGQQNRYYLAATLQQLSASYSFSHPSVSDANIGNDFAGVSNANVNQAHSDSASVADTFRGIYNREKIWSAGLDQLIAYSRSRSGSTTTPPGTSVVASPGGPEPLPNSTSTLSANSLIVSPFFQLQPFRDQPRMMGVVRLLANSDVANNLQFVKTGTKLGSGTGAETLYFPVEPRRQHGLAPAVGARFELSNSNYAEFGYLLQFTKFQLYAIGDTQGAITTPVVGGPVVIGAAQSISKILNGVTTAGTTDQLKYYYNGIKQNGIYGMGVWNSNLLGQKSLTNSFVYFVNVFAPGNPATRSSTETHYAANVSDTFSVAMLGNLSLGPQYTLFLYGDQATGITSTITRHQLSVALNYNFDWHSGLSSRAFWTPGQGAAH
jgi:hypothetical protein